MKISIVEASLKDLEKLLGWRMRVLETVFGIEDKKEYQKLFNENEDYYRKALPSGEHVAVFAEDGDETVGCGGVCLYREMPSPDNPTGRCAYIMNIYTRETYRNQGIARQVLEALIRRAKHLGVGKIYLESTEEAKKLYRTLGFVDLRDYMILED